MDESEKRVPKREVELDIPEGEGEILCNVEFKLAYGGKILLNTTHFHVRRGRIYGLLGHNGCGKSMVGVFASEPSMSWSTKHARSFMSSSAPGKPASWPLEMARMSVDLPQPLWPRRP